MPSEGDGRTEAFGPDPAGGLTPADRRAVQDELRRLPKRGAAAMLLRAVLAEDRPWVRLHIGGVLRLLSDARGEGEARRAVPPRGRPKEEPYWGKDATRARLVDWELEERQNTHPLGAARPVKDVIADLKREARQPGTFTPHARLIEDAFPGQPTEAALMTWAKSVAMGRRILRKWNNVPLGNMPPIVSAPRPRRVRKK